MYLNLFKYKCILYMGLVNLSNQQFGDVCLVQEEARKRGPQRPQDGIVLIAVSYSNHITSV